MTTPTTVRATTGDQRRGIFSFDGGEWTVRPILAINFEAFLHAVEPLLDFADAKVLSGDRESLVAFLKANTTRVIEAIAPAVGQPVGEVKKLDIYELIELAALVLELNLDFFVRRAAPALARVAAAAFRITQKI